MSFSSTWLTAPARHSRATSSYCATKKIDFILPHPPVLMSVATNTNLSYFVCCPVEFLSSCRQATTSIPLCPKRSHLSSCVETSMRTFLSVPIGTLLFLYVRVYCVSFIANATNDQDQPVHIRATLLDAFPIVNSRVATVDSICTSISSRHQYGRLSNATNYQLLSSTNSARSRKAAKQPEHLWPITRDLVLDSFGWTRNPILHCFGCPTYSHDIDLPSTSIPTIHHRSPL